MRGTNFKSIPHKTGYCFNTQNMYSLYFDIYMSHTRMFISRPISRLRLYYYYISRCVQWPHTTIGIGQIKLEPSWLLWYILPWRQRIWGVSRLSAYLISGLIRCKWKGKQNHVISARTKKTLIQFWSAFVSKYLSLKWFLICLI